MKYILTYLILLFVDSASCQGQSKEDLIGEPVNIVAIKTLQWAIFTSGVVSSTDSKRYCSDDSLGIYGFYFLIDKEIGAPIGKLIIHTRESAQNWRADNKDEEFASIELKSNKIKVWNKISVGSTEKDVLELIGENFHYKKGTIIHADIDNYSADFTIVNDTVNKIIISKTCH